MTDWSADPGDEGAGESKADGADAGDGTGRREEPATESATGAGSSSDAEGGRPTMTRRGMLELAGLSAASVGLSGCQSDDGDGDPGTARPETPSERPPTPTRSPTPTPTRSPTPTPTPRETTARPTTEPADRTTVETAGETEPDTTVRDTETDDGTVEKSVQDFLWWTMRGYIPDETLAIRQISNEFEDVADRNVNVTTETITWDAVFQEWTAAIRSSSAPDVSEMAGQHAVTMAHQGHVEPKTGLFESDEDWYEVVSNWGRYDGEVWGVPWFTETRVSHVNRNLLDDAGVDAPPETWQDIVDAGRTVVTETDASAGWTTPGDAGFRTGQNVTAITHQSGGGMYGYEDGRFTVEADAAASLFAHLWVLSLREQWDIAPGDWGGVGGLEARDTYLGGETAVVHSPANLSRQLVDPHDGVNPRYRDLAEATELTRMPAGPTGERRSFAGGSCLASFRDDTADYGAGSALSAEFVEYMTRADQVGEHFRTVAPNLLPARSGQAEIPLFRNNPTEIPDPWLDTRLEQLPDAVRYGTSGAGRCGPFMTTLESTTTGYSDAAAGMIGNDIDPKTALRSMANQMRSAVTESDATDYTLEERTDGPSLDDAPDAVQPWIEGDGVPQIYNPDD